MDASWVNDHWKNLDLGDERLNARAKTIASACVQKPWASLSERLETWGDLKAAYRFFDNEKATFRKIQEPHYQHVRRLARKSEQPVLFIQDGSELLYNTHNWTAGLGPTADAYGNGMMMHTSLVVRLEEDGNAEILGLGYQKLWVRDQPQEETPEGVKAAKKRAEEKESAVWAETLREIGPPPRDKAWITVCDRGSDFFDFIEHAANTGWGYVVRAKHNRNVVVHGKKSKLFDWIRAQGGKSEQEIWLRARKGKSSREAVLQLTWGETEIIDPTKSNSTLKVNVLRVHNKEEELEWIILTNLTIETGEEACRIVEMYRRRWLIEEYHKALKSGCGAEKAQLRHVNRLRVLIGILGVVATQLLALRERSRMDPLTLVEEVIPNSWIEIVARMSKCSAKQLTLGEFWRLVAKMGGFLGRKSDGEPGWISLWRGMRRVLDMDLAISEFRTCR